MFELICRDEETGARVGKLYTAHGIVDTPAFMPVATKASVKTLDSEELASLGTQAIISNAFILYLRPSVEIIKEAGGVHKFMNFHGAIFTDSGGFQMLNDKLLIQVSKKGAIFQSPFDSTRHRFTPQKCIEVQMELGSDVAMVLDDCPPYGSDYEHVKQSTQRTSEWARIAMETHNKEDQALCCIIQGGTFPDLRKQSAAALVEMDFAGYAIGGLCIGEPKKLMYEVLDCTVPLIPENKIRYLMGVGAPLDLLESISKGIDLFDSVYPTRNARHSIAYTHKGKFSLRRGRFARDFAAIDKDCQCPACKSYSRAYIHHLLKVHEMLGMRLVTLHNLFFLQELLSNARRAILKSEFPEYKKEVEDAYRGSSAERRDQG